MNIKLDIPEDFFKGEKRSGYYVSPEMKKVWAVELDLIAEFARVCGKYNLKWHMAYGTLLGAARHKGFIPWDDDIDVTMMRGDYERLLEVAGDEFRNPYSLRTIYNDGTNLAFAKLHNESTTQLEEKATRRIKEGGSINFSQGIFIDIFPIDNIPDDEKEANKFLRKAKKLRLEADIAYSCGTYYYPSANIIKRTVKATIHFILTMLRVESFPCIKRFDEFIKSNHNQNSRRVGSLTLCYFRNIDNFKAKEFWDRSLLDATINLPFEMLSLPAPSEYDKLLTQYFGDWHTPVVYHAHGQFFDTEHSYTDYINRGKQIQPL